MTIKTSNCNDGVLRSLELTRQPFSASRCGEHLQGWLGYVYRLTHDVKNFRKKNVSDTLYQGMIMSTQEGLWVWEKAY